MPSRGGFALAMNRDEQRTRPAARPPAQHQAGHLTAWHPSEPAGGTWIGINERGIALALLNGHQRPPDSALASRGLIIPELLAAVNLAELQGLFAGLETRAFNPFRLIAVDPRAEEIREWIWDGVNTAMNRPPWQLVHWFSSGFDEPRVVAARTAVARRAAKEADAGRLSWVRRLHASHEPRSGPYSICLHRSDAKTVSYTEIVWADESPRMEYFPTSLCEAQVGA